MIVEKYTNIVRFLVKKGQQQEFENLFKTARSWEGLTLHVLAKTGERSYASFGLWESESAMINARPSMISLLDSARDLLDEISPELGVTDPVSGPVIFAQRQ
jgi:hypothetical protein